MERKRALHTIVTVGFVGLLVFTWWAGRAPSSARSNAFGFTLTESSKQAGIDFVHKPARLDPIMPHIAGMGAAVSVADVDGDGWPDLYATNSAFGAPNALYVNQRDGTFRDVAAAAGIADLNREGEGASMGSIWADYDNDG